MTEPFFSRWSKRKQALAQGLPVAEPVTPDRPLQEPSGTGLVSGGGVPDKGASAAQGPVGLAEAGRQETNPSDPTAQALPTLEDAKGLTAESDFQPFMRPGVASDVRNAAVKKLFADPHFNVMDGLDIYIGDYNTPDPLPAGMLQKMVGAQLLNLFPEGQPSPEVSSETARRLLSPDVAPENPDQSPDAQQGSPLVAQSPSSTTQALQPTTALQAFETTEHDDPDLQLQPNHAPASPSSGSSTG